jgi:hypothetical protein
MTEEFLHFIWKFRLFIRPLKLTTGEEVSVLHPGEHNSDAGPDFLGARLKIDNTTWAGNVEIHVHASEWFHHGHDRDMAYDSVLAHVVYDNDCEVRRKNGEMIPVVPLRGTFDERLYERYRRLLASRSWVPCAPLLGSVERLSINNWIDRLAVERLEHKSAMVEDVLQRNGLDWEQTFYQFFCRSFGFHVNSTPFEMLAGSLPYKYLVRQKDSLLQIEALLFGQSGMLERKFRDEYMVGLQREYRHLQNKFHLLPLDAHLWRFLRLNPPNFPTIRLAQLASLIHRSPALFSRVLECTSLGETEHLFGGEVSAYWETHYLPEKSSPRRKKPMGKASCDLILINTVIPFLFIYGKIKGQPGHSDRALKFLDQLPGERNAVVNRWKKTGMPVQSAFQTQALLELKASYCASRRCLSCGIGNFLLRQEEL